MNRLVTDWPVAIIKAMGFSTLTRRQALESCISRGLLISGVAMSQTKLFAAWQAAEAAAQKPTAREVLGPFYKKGAPNMKQLRPAGDPGFPLTVAGKVVNTKGQLVEGVKIDIWHSDHHGRYDLVGFKYRSQLTADEKGLYSVETILPGPYDDRPAQHIHYLIAAPGHKTLVTQAYFATDPFFEGDPDKKFGKRNIVHNRELVRPVSLYEGPGAPRAAISFDICLETA